MTVKHGMPFYFRDLRDGALIFFRAYLSGITDSISPSWNPENYVGRSEPVYTYKNAERGIDFNLKLFANTKDELNMIYNKINRLTSLCYPEYLKGGEFEVKSTDDTTVATLAIGSDTLRMKPPLVKFRMGELFGSNKKEMVGFIKTLNYTFPEESPWEIQAGKRVPKYVDATIGFQVIHSTVPSLDFAKITNDNQNSFYGINQTLIEDDFGGNIDEPFKTLGDIT